MVYGRKFIGGRQRACANSLSAIVGPPSDAAIRMLA